MEPSNELMQRIFEAFDQPDKPTHELLEKVKFLCNQYNGYNLEVIKIAISNEVE